MNNKEKWVWIIWITSYASRPKRTEVCRQFLRVNFMRRPSKQNTTISGNSQNSIFDINLKMCEYVQSLDVISDGISVESSQVPWLHSLATDDVTRNLAHIQRKMWHILIVFSWLTLLSQQCERDSSCLTRPVDKQLDSHAHVWPGQPVRPDQVRTSLSHRVKSFCPTQADMNAGKLWLNQQY